MVSRLLQYFTLDSGKVLLNQQGAERLIPRISKRANNSWNGKFLKDGPLKEKLTKEIEVLKLKIVPPNVNVSDHHIFPGNQINQMLKGALSTTEGLKRVNDYINSRKGIQALLRYQIDEENEVNAVDDVWSSVYWFQYNLVLGP